MRINQISVFIENRAGAMLEVTGVLAEDGIDIRALSLADTADYGILRLIVSDPAKAAETFKKRQITFASTDVIAAKLDDRPGGLYKVLTALGSKGVSIEYMYAFLTPAESDAYAVFRIEDFDSGVKALQEAGIQLLEAKSLYKV